MVLTAFLCINDEVNRDSEEAGLATRLEGAENKQDLTESAPSLTSDPPNPPICSGDAHFREAAHCALSIDSRRLLIVFRKHVWQDKQRTGAL